MDTHSEGLLRGLVEVPKWAYTITRRTCPRVQDYPVNFRFATYWTYSNDRFDLKQGRHEGNRAHRGGLTRKVSKDISF